MTAKLMESEKKNERDEREMSYQWCGSIFLGLLDPDPDPLVRGTDPDH
jgi:hypothetical protein